ncbi:MAG TPA: OsmC family protein [Candidatus Kapabacteria bacterium]|nr:OsmC family protein [Candidatus Kapabacteria bacterium]
MQHTVTSEWKGGMQFDANVLGFTLSFDETHDDGTHMLGTSPKRTLLAAAGACTGIDVVSMLEKMRISFDNLSIAVEADVAENHPKVYTKMKITYRFIGKGLQEHRSQIEHAVSLSQEKYCSVSAMLRKAMEITTEIEIS